jgi:hypothetical protein
MWSSHLVSPPTGYVDFALRRFLNLYGTRRMILRCTVTVTHIVRGTVAFPYPALRFSSKCLALAHD